MFKRIQNAVQQEGEFRADGGSSVEQTHADTEGMAEPASPGIEGQSTEVPESGANTDDPPVDIGQVFSILQNQRRRDVLGYLLDASGPVTLSDLAEHIAARECEKPARQLSSQERKRVYVALYQCHLSKMANSAAIRYDQDRGIVEPGPDFDRFTTYLPAEARPKGDATDSLRQYVSGIFRRS